MNRFLDATYCEDIRHEMGGKRSLMGVFNGAIIVPTPTILPKLCISTTFVARLDDEITSLKFNVFKDNALIASVPIPIDQINATKSIVEDPQWKRVTTDFVFNPFELKQSGKLTVTAETDQETLEATPLHLIVDPDIQRKVEQANLN